MPPFFVTSKVNGISIFLKTEGYYDGGTLETAYGQYFWSSTPYDDNYAWAFGFPNYGIGTDAMNYRWDGYAIRPVQN